MGLNKQIYIIIVFLSYSVGIHATRLITDLSFNYHSDSETADNTNYNRFDYRLFIGAGLSQKVGMFFGQHVMMVNREMKSNGSSQSDTISIMELGPKIIYFFNDLKSFGIALGWNPYAKGSRTRNGATEDVSGSSMLASLVVQARVTKKFFVGVSINYHSLSIAESTDTSNTTTDVSHSYTSIYPMFDLSFRFK